MVHFTDPKQLLSDQYHDDAKLNVRLALHERFSTNPYPWHRWVFDQMTMLPGDVVLEVGCGSGMLWLKNRDRLSEQYRFTPSDFSLGMVRASRRALGEAGFELDRLRASIEGAIAADGAYHVTKNARLLIATP